MRNTLLAFLFFGSAAMAAEEPLLRNVEQLGSETTYEKYASTVFDGQGRFCVVRTTTMSGIDVILFRCRDGGRWSADERLDAGTGVESGSKVVRESDGSLRVFWHGRRDGRWAIYSRRRGNAGWGPEQRLTSETKDALHPAAVAGTDGSLWLAYEVTKPGGFFIELISTTARQDGTAATWSAPMAISSNGSDRRPAMATGSAGEVWLAWDSTRTGNYDIFLTRLGRRAGAPRILEQIQATAHGTIDDSPSVAVAADGTLWLAWNGMRGHARDQYRADRHSGDAFVRVYRNGQWLAPPALVSRGFPGQVSLGAVNKSPRDAVDPYWHWKQTQNYPIVFTDSSSRAWIIWRTDATGAHNFDLWARVHDGSRLSPELHLTTFSPGRDEWPTAAIAPDKTIQLTWEGQLLPEPGEEAKYSGGDVDSYNTLGMPNVILTASLQVPLEGWHDAPLQPVARDVFRAEETGEVELPGRKSPPAARGKYKILFGDPHSHTILSDGKTGLPDQILELSRDAIGLDYAVVSDHTEMGRLQATEYAELQLTAAAYTQRGRFVSLTGWEWTAGPAYGHRVILYGHDGGPPLSFTSGSEGNTIEKLYEHTRKDHGVMSPHHTGQATWGRWNPDAHHDEELEPNFEIASWHGRFEYYGNPREGRRQVPGHQYQDALRRGRHVGVMGASDTHHLSPGEGGLTAVLATALDRESIFDAIRNRRNYATTGARILLEFEAAGAVMGSRISVPGPVALMVRVEGTAPIDRVEIVRNLVDTFAAVRIEQNPTATEGVYVLYEPRAPQTVNTLKAPDTRVLQFTVKDEDRLPGETSYYVRVTQSDGHQAWSSPIWVTQNP